MPQALPFIPVWVPWAWRAEFPPEAPSSGVGGHRALGHTWQVGQSFAQGGGPSGSQSPTSCLLCLSRMQPSDSLHSSSQSSSIPADLGCFRSGAGRGAPSTEKPHFIRQTQINPAQPSSGLVNPCAGQTHGMSSGAFAKRRPFRILAAGSTLASWHKCQGMFGRADPSFKMAYQRFRGQDARESCESLLPAPGEKSHLPLDSLGLQSPLPLEERA